MATTSAISSILSILITLVMGVSFVGGATPATLPTQVDYTYEATYTLDGQEGALNASLSLDAAAPALLMDLNGQTFSFRDGALTVTDADGYSDTQEIPAEALEILSQMASYLADGGLEADLTALLPYLADFPDFNAYTLTYETVAANNGSPVIRYTFETTPLRLLSAAHRWAAWHACDEKLMQDVKNLKLFSLPGVQKLLKAQDIEPEKAFTMLMRSLSNELSNAIDNAYGYNLTAPLRVTVDFSARGLVTAAHAEIVLSEDSYAPEDPEDKIVIRADYSRGLQGNNPTVNVLVTKADNAVFSGVFSVQGSQLTCSARYSALSSYAEGFDFLLTADENGLNAGLSIHNDDTNPSYTLNVKNQSISFLYLESDYCGGESAPFVRGLLTWEEDGKYALDVHANSFKLTGGGSFAMIDDRYIHTLELTGFSIINGDVNDRPGDGMTVNARLVQILSQENGTLVLRDHLEAAPEGQEEQYFLDYSDTHTLTVR